MATKFDAPIDKLRENKHLSEEQYNILAHYAQQARTAERSAIRDSCDFSVRGGPAGEPGAAIISARLQTALLENRAGRYVSIVRAVVRDEQSLSQYCIDKHGGRERYDKRGRFVAMVPRSEKRVMAAARGDLRRAAKRMIGGA